MAASIDPVQAAANLKRIYGPEFHKVKIPEAKIQQLFPFEEQDRPGESYNEAIRMTEEHGYTLRASGSPASSNPLNASVAMKVERASINGSILDFVSRIDIEVMQSAMGSKQAFKDAVGLRVEGMRDGMSRHLEYSLLYGGLPMCTVSGAPTGAAGVYTLTVAATDWAGGWWAGIEGMPVDVYASGGAKITNTLGGTTITGYDLSARTITLTGPNAELSTIASGAKVWRLGETAATTAPGLVQLCSVQTGVVNNISATNYPMWRPAVQTVNGQLTFGQVLQTDSKASERGLARGGKKLWISNRNYAVINTDLSASRKYDGSYSRKKGTNGFGAIEYYSTGGTIEVEVHPYLKDGDAVLFDTSTITRRGVSDITFEYMGKEMFVLVQGQQAYEYRGYSHQGLFCNAPARNAFMSGLVVPT